MRFETTLIFESPGWRSQLEFENRFQEVDFIRVAHECRRMGVTPMEMYVGIDRYREMDISDKGDNFTEFVAPGVAFMISPSHGIFGRVIVVNGWISTQAQSVGPATEVQ